jgi:hypothetical protein
MLYGQNSRLGDWQGKIPSLNPRIKRPSCASYNFYIKTERQEPHQKISGEESCVLRISFLNLIDFDLITVFVLLVLLLIIFTSGCTQSPILTIERANSTNLPD